MSALKVAVIGGGAAGFFAAISCKVHHPESIVTIYERSNKLLSKVKVSGGGRCNVTNACPTISQFVKSYPRGGQQLKKVFHQFGQPDTVAWYESRGVELKAEEDDRMFPTTDNSQTIIDCLLTEARKLGIHIRKRCQVDRLEATAEGFHIHSSIGETVQMDKVIIASGGSPKIQGFDWLVDLGHTVEPPVPSLFTFNIPKDNITELMGITITDAKVHIQSTKLAYQGPVLVTHWGMSGPAVLKLSAWGARVLASMGYHFTVQVNWLAGQSEHEVRDKLMAHLKGFGKRKIVNKNPFDLPSRFWAFLLSKSAINETKTWTDLGKKDTNRLINTLVNDAYHVRGKTTFKEEFVTCGGVNLAEVDFKTMQSKIVHNLYFAGEVLDVDGITGGFNFQAAWSTGFVAGKLQ